MMKLLMILFIYFFFFTVISYIPYKLDIKESKFFNFFIFNFIPKTKGKDRYDIIIKIVLN